MVRNSEKLELATHYRKRGFSYSEIANICGVSKATVSNWLAKKAFSKRVKQDNIVKASHENVKRLALINKTRQKERTVRYKEAERTAQSEYRHYKKDPKFMAGLSLYLAQGDQADPNRIRLASGRIELHAMFLRFAREYLGVSRESVRFWLSCGVEQNETMLVKLWRNKLKLSPTQCHQTQKTKGSPGRQTLQYGVGNTIIASTVLKRKLMTWSELATKELQK